MPINCTCLNYDYPDPNCPIHGWNFMKLTPFREFGPDAVLTVGTFNVYEGDPYTYCSPFPVMAKEKETYKSFDDYVDDCVAVSLDRLKKDSRTDGMTRTVKLGEEVGEFNEAMLFHYGFNQHKKLKEGIFGEGADVINCIIGALVAANPKMKPEDVIKELKSELHRKLSRYKKRK